MQFEFLDTKVIATSLDVRLGYIEATQLIEILMLIEAVWGLDLANDFDMFEARKILIKSVINN